MQNELQIPDSKNKSGYTDKELLDICSFYKVNSNIFFDRIESSVNTIQKDDVINILHQILNDNYLFWR